MVKIKFKDWMYMNAGIVLIALAVALFLAPNKFVTGGMTGLSTILEQITPIPMSVWLIFLNITMLVVGFVVLGKKIGFWTVYCCLSYTGLNFLLQSIIPKEWLPLTQGNEMFLELCVGILLYAAGTAIIFYAGASSGGMDIVALIIQKYTSIDVGKAVLYVNSFIAVFSIFVFKQITPGILSLVGLFINSFVIDTVIDNFNSCKYFMVITDKPELVAEYIMNELHHGVTVSDAVGAYTQQKKGMVHTVCRRYEAIRLRQAIKKIDENAFMVITTSSEIIGKGFRSV